MSSCLEDASDVLYMSSNKQCHSCCNLLMQLQSKMTQIEFEVLVMNHNIFFIITTVTILLRLVYLFPLSYLD